MQDLADIENGLRILARALGQLGDYTGASRNLMALASIKFRTKELELKGLNMDGTAPEVKVVLTDFADALGRAEPGALRRGLCGGIAMMCFNRPKRLITTMAAVAIVALGAAPVSAQMMGGGGTGGGGMGGGKGHRGTQEGQKNDAKPKPKVDEKAYNSALSGMPDRKFDPWKSAR